MLLDSTLAQMDSATRAAIVAGRSRSDLLEHLRDSLQGLIDLEAHFFHRIGVDQRITTLGFSVQPPALASGRYVGWDYSLADLTTLGLHGLAIKGGEPWEPRLPWNSIHIYRVDLSDIADFHAQVFAEYPSG